MPTDKLNFDYMPGHLELLLQSQDYEAVEKLLHSFRPEDMAEVLLQLSRSDIREILEHIDVELASELVECIDDMYWNELLSPLSQERLLAILINLASDDAADLLEELEEDVRNDLLARSAKQPDLASVRALLMYPEETAGAIMNPDFFLMPQYLDVDHALNNIRQNIDQFQDISTLFITNLKGQLTGTLDLPALISAPTKTRLRDIMDKDFIAVDVLMDEDDVVDVVRKYELTTVPVVDAQGLLMGLITIDDIIDVIEEQADEEAYKMAAMPEPDAQDSAFRAALVRIPWLLICLGGSLSAGTIIHLFERTLSEVIVLAAFMPAIMGMAGNTGVQTATLVIRNMTDGPSLRSYLWKLVLREFRTAFFIGLTCGILAGSMAWLGFHANPLIGLVIGFSLFLSILSSTFLGTSIPYFFQRMSIDPAVASGPFVTTINDSTALIIYLSIATFTLRFLPALP